MSWFNLCSVVLKLKNLHISKYVEVSQNNWAPTSLYTHQENQTHFLGSVTLLSHFDKVLALSKFTLLKYKIEVNPIAWIP